jgi:hypothetical protein
VSVPASEDSYDGTGDIVRLVECIVTGLLNHGRGFLEAVLVPLRSRARYASVTIVHCYTTPTRSGIE